MMNKEDLIILLIGLLLVAGMIVTVIFGGEKSLHGVGMFSRETLDLYVSLTDHIRFKNMLPGLEVLNDETLVNTQCFIQTTLI